jgi:hypothetical protein
VEKELFHSADSLAEIVIVSYLTIIHHLRDSLGMKVFHLRWVLHELIPDLRRR